VSFTVRAWGSVLLAAVGLLAARAPGSAAPDPPPDAELLLNLDLLKEADLARQADLYRRMSLVQRLRVLEILKFLEGQPPAPATSKPREVDAR